MSINHWLLENLKYYRRMDFFQEYQALSDLELLAEIEKKANNSSPDYCRFFLNSYQVNENHLHGMY